MRTQLVLFTLAISASAAQAQNPGIEAAQQAAQQAQMASQLATQAAIQANQQAAMGAQQAMRQAQTNALNSSWGPCCPPAAKPKFSVKPGVYSSAKTVKIKDRTRGAIIYYTTDGWTPTTASVRYTGPITIDSTMTLQAIAIAPYYARSRVTSAQYKLHVAPTAPSETAPSTAEEQSAVANVPVAPQSGQLVLRQGTPVHLVFAADVSSKRADVGDKLPLTLAEDLKVGDTILVKKGATAVATVTEADGKRAAGVPGEIAFEADYLNADGARVKLFGTALKEGQDKVVTARTLFLALGPLGPAGLLEHGEDAQIKQGTAFTAFVDADTPLSPAN
jgi:Chitobiase/beta-hexosaminidase C-terminal domain